MSLLPTKLLMSWEDLGTDHSDVPADSRTDDVNNIVADFFTLPFPHRAVSQVSGSAPSEHLCGVIPGQGRSVRTYRQGRSFLISRPSPEPFSRTLTRCTAPLETADQMPQGLLRSKLQYGTSHAATYSYVHAMSCC